MPEDTISDMTANRDVEVAHEVSSFAYELRRLADALDAGTTYTLHIDGEDVTIPEGALFSVAHEREDGAVELEFQVTWTSNAPIGNDDDSEADTAAANLDEAEAE